MEQAAKTSSAPEARDSTYVAYSLNSSEEVPEAREQLEAWIRRMGPAIDELRTYEILLATNELMSNGFEHGSGNGCKLEIQFEAGSLIVAVTNETAEFTPKSTDDWHMPDATSRSGRGLAIVKNVADKIDVDSDRSYLRIAAHFDLGQKTTADVPNEATLAE